MHKSNLYGSGHLENAKDWPSCAQVDCSWQFGASVGVGEAGSLHVVGPDGLQCFAKPAFQAGSGVPRAAHEKVASDIAHILGLSVPPVTLVKSDVPDKLFSVSASAFRQPLTWDQSAPMRTAKFNSNVLAQLAEGQVFHTWIQDLDHYGHGGNLLVDAESSEDDPRIAFIDHAFSLSHAWTKSVDFGQCAAILPYYALPDQFPVASIAEMLRKVQDISAGQISEVLDRVPDVYLSESTKEVIFRGLCERQKTIARAFRV